MWKSMSHDQYLTLKTAIMTGVVTAVSGQVKVTVRGSNGQLS